MKKMKNILASTIAATILGAAVVAPVGLVLLNPTVASAETLEGIGIDPTPLRNAVSAVDSARADKQIYTEESFEAFETALVTGEYIEYIKSYYDFGVATLARGTYDPAFPGVGQTEFDTALEGINSALAQLVLKDTEPPANTVNYTVLGLDEAGNQLYEIPKTAENGATVTEIAQAWPGYTSVGETTQNVVVESGLYVYFYYNKDVAPVDPDAVTTWSPSYTIDSEKFTFSHPSFVLGSGIAPASYTYQVTLNGVSGEVLPYNPNTLIAVPFDDKNISNEVIITLWAQYADANPFAQQQLGQLKQVSEPFIDPVDPVDPVDKDTSTPVKDDNSTVNTPSDNAVVTDTAKTEVTPSDNAVATDAAKTEAKSPVRQTAAGDDSGFPIFSVMTGLVGLAVIVIRKKFFA